MRDSITAVLTVLVVLAVIIPAGAVIPDRVSAQSADNYDVWVGERSGIGSGGYEGWDENGTQIYSAGSDEYRDVDYDPTTDVIYGAKTDGAIAFRQNGSVVWENASSNAQGVTNYVAYDSEKVYTVNTNEWITARYKDNGSIAWEFQYSTQTTPRGLAVGPNGFLWYANATSNRVAKFHPSNGTFVESFEAYTTNAVRQLHGTSEYVLVGSDTTDGQGKLRKYYANNTAAWTYNTEDNVAAVGGDGKYALVGTLNGYVSKLHAENGSEVWKVQAITGDSVRGLALGTNYTVYSGGGDNGLTRHDADTGADLWSFATNGEPYGITAEFQGTEEPAGTPTPTPAQTELALDTRSWLPLNSTQTYTVTWTNETGVHDVTASSNVTSSNSSVIAVNESAAELESFGLVGRVVITAEYNSETVTQNVTTGPRNLSNIGIMPPEQWPCSFLECDENPSGGENPHNIGSPMQWLWLIIVIMVAATRFAENPWAGVGTGIVFSILVWVLEYIDLGSVLVTVFSGLLIGAMMARTSMGRGVTRDNERSGIQANNQRNE